MAIVGARSAAHIGIIRARWAEIDNPPTYPLDSDLPLNDPNVSMFVDRPTGAFGQAAYFPLDGISYITWLLPESLGQGRHARMLRRLLDDLYDRHPAARDQRVEGTFRHGLEVGTGLEDYGWGKAIAWSILVPGTTVDLLPDRATCSSILSVARGALRAALR